MQRLPRARLALAALAATLTAVPAVALAGGEARSAASAGTGQFNTPCLFSHRAPDDPIVAPGRRGGSHSHDFIGNTSTNAHSTLASLRAAPARCRRAADRSAYWVPTLYVRGRAVAPRLANAYYRTAGRDPATIASFPSGLQVIAGDAKARRRQSTRVVRWSCAPRGGRAGARKLRRLLRKHRRTIRRHRRALRRALLATPRDRRAVRHHRRVLRRYQRAIRRMLRSGARVPACRRGTELRTTIRFPECWDGRRLDSPDHKSHLAYARWSRAARRRACPASHATAVPKLVLEVRYRTRGGRGVRLASGGAHTMHADFFNAWDARALRALVRRCLNAGRPCGSG